MEQNNTLLNATRAFWDLNPCDGHSNVFHRMKYKHRKEPWILPVLEEISQYSNVLEVGCGQGTDALYCCSRMSEGSAYTAIDYSPGSIELAKQSATQIREKLNIIPDFRIGNAESLPFQDGAFDCVISIGVLHHTPNTKAGIGELHRVVQDNGRVYVGLYRLLSPKVIVAKMVRRISRIIDQRTGRVDFMYSLCRRLGSNHFLGTMLLECTGVPILRAYTYQQIRKLFECFAAVQIKPVGMGLPYFGLNNYFDKGHNILGSLWLIKASKGYPSDDKASNIKGTGSFEDQ